MDPRSRKRKHSGTMPTSATRGHLTSSSTSKGRVNKRRKIPTLDDNLVHVEPHKCPARKPFNKDWHGLSGKARDPTPRKTSASSFAPTPLPSTKSTKRARRRAKRRGLHIEPSQVPTNVNISEQAKVSGSTRYSITQKSNTLSVLPEETFSNPIFDIRAVAHTQLARPPIKKWIDVSGAPVSLPNLPELSGNDAANKGGKDYGQARRLAYSLSEAPRNRPLPRQDRDGKVNMATSVKRSISDRTHETTYPKGGLSLPLHKPAAVMPSPSGPPRRSARPSISNGMIRVKPMRGFRNISIPDCSISSVDTAATLRRFEEMSSSAQSDETDSSVNSECERDSRIGDQAGVRRSTAPVQPQLLKRSDRLSIECPPKHREGGSRSIGHVHGYNISEGSPDCQHTPHAQLDQTSYEAELARKLGYDRSVPDACPPLVRSVAAQRTTCVWLEDVTPVHESERYIDSSEPEKAISPAPTTRKAVIADDNTSKYAKSIKATSKVFPRPKEAQRRVSVWLEDVTPANDFEQYINDSELAETNGLSRRNAYKIRSSQTGHLMIAGNQNCDDVGQNRSRIPSVKAARPPQSHNSARCSLVPGPTSFANTGVRRIAPEQRLDEHLSAHDGNGTSNPSSTIPSKKVFIVDDDLSLEDIYKDIDDVVKITLGVPDATFSIENCKPLPVLKPFQGTENILILDGHRSRTTSDIDNGIGAFEQLGQSAIDIKRETEESATDSDSTQGIDAGTNKTLAIGFERGRHTARGQQQNEHHDHRSNQQGRHQIVHEQESNQNEQSQKRPLSSSSSDLSDLGSTPTPPASLLTFAPRLHRTYSPQVVISRTEWPPSETKRRVTGNTSAHFSTRRQHQTTRRKSSVPHGRTYTRAQSTSIDAESQADEPKLGAPYAASAVKSADQSQERNSSNDQDGVRKSDFNEVSEATAPGARYGAKMRVAPKAKSRTPRAKRKSTGKISEHFIADRVDKYNTTAGSRRAPAGISVVPVPSINERHFGIVQEKYWMQPFWLLVAVTLLNKTSGRAAMPVFRKLVARYSTVEDLAQAKHDDVLSMIQGLGLQNNRTKSLIRMAQSWVEAPPVRGRLYRTKDYPNKGDGKAVDVAKVVEEDVPICAGALEIGNLSGCGAYAYDSWRIFCRDVLRGVAEDYNGKNATAEDFEPEWKRVVPGDKELRACLRWMWLREGWIWDPLTGSKRRVTEEERERAVQGEMEIEDAQEQKFAGLAAAGAATSGHLSSKSWEERCSDHDNDYDNDDGDGGNESNRHIGMSTNMDTDEDDPPFNRPTKSFEASNARTTPQYESAAEPIKDMLLSIEGNGDIDDIDISTPVRPARTPQSRSERRRTPSRWAKVVQSVERDDVESPSIKGACASSRPRSAGKSAVEKKGRQSAKRPTRTERLKKGKRKRLKSLSDG